MLIAYYRVSTARQGRSGLGLDAQREAVRAYAALRLCPAVRTPADVDRLAGRWPGLRREVLAAARLG